MPPRQTPKALQYVADFRRLRPQCIHHLGAADRELDHMAINLEAPDEPELALIFQPPVTSDITRFLLDPAARCVHAFGGPDPGPKEVEEVKTLPLACARRSDR